MHFHESYDQLRAQEDFIDFRVSPITSKGPGTGAKSYLAQGIALSQNLLDSLQAAQAVRLLPAADLADPTSGGILGASPFSDIIVTCLATHTR